MKTVTEASHAREARDVREAGADSRLYPPPEHSNNGEENEYRTGNELNYIANYHKGLPHNQFGEVVPGDYRTMLRALTTGAPEDFERIPLGTRPPVMTGDPTPRKLTSPRAGRAYDMEGPDAQPLAMASAPRIDGPETAAEMAELYWMALLRDVPFTDYASNVEVAEAANNLSSQFSTFLGPKDKSGNVTPATLFRGFTPEDQVGPYLSQFLLRGNKYPGLGLDESDGAIKYGTLRVLQRQGTVVPDIDYMIDFSSWLAIQNGADTSGGEVFDNTPRFIRNLRDLANYVHSDALYEAYLNACLILLHLDVPGSPLPALSADVGSHYSSSRTPLDFATFDGPHILSMVCEVATRALKAVWFQKWFVHRRLHPEAYGGLVHLHVKGMRSYPLNEEILETGPGSVLDRVHSYNVNKGSDSYLLPMAFSEGSPTHPAYGAGHAAVAGACVTILKAWFDESFVIDEVFVPSPSGTKLVKYAAQDGERPLTVGGELNKLAANIAIGRSGGGVHWRSDYTESIKLGEAVAIGILRDRKRTNNEPTPLTLTKFDGKQVTI